MDEQRVREAVEQIVAKYLDKTSYPLKNQWFKLGAKPDKLVDEITLLVLDMMQGATV